LGLQKFFRGFFPVASLDDIREQSFALYYFSEGGIAYRDVEEMEASERNWHLRRIAKQKTDEQEAIKRAQADAKKGAKRRRR
jgi:Sec7-like guanine-nucleotide exchange factor